MSVHRAGPLAGYCNGEVPKFGQICFDIHSLMSDLGGLCEAAGPGPTVEALHKYTYNHIRIYIYMYMYTIYNYIDPIYNPCIYRICKMCSPNYKNKKVNVNVKYFRKRLWFCLRSLNLLCCRSRGDRHESSKSIAQVLGR